jgi:hypothetical protein
VMKGKSMPFSRSSRHRISWQEGGVKVGTAVHARGWREHEVVIVCYPLYGHVRCMAEAPAERRIS